MSKPLEKFKEDVRTVVLDEEGTHHVLSSGLHGRKLDFGKVSVDSNLYERWVAISTEQIRQMTIADYAGRIALIGVASGTNRLVLDVAKTLGDDSKGFLTEKTADGIIRLNREEGSRLSEFQPQLAVVMEDVGTTGSSALAAVIEAWSAGCERVEVLNTWQRRPNLEALDNYEVIYHAAIFETLPDFTPDECRYYPKGYCAQGWELIEE